MTALPPQGWFPDPQNAAQARWWDGARWTEQTQPIAPTPVAVERPAPPQVAASPIFSPAHFTPAGSSFSALTPSTEVASYGPADPDFPYERRAHISFSYGGPTPVAPGPVGTIAATAHDPHSYYGAQALSAHFVPAPHRTGPGAGKIIAIVAAILIVGALVVAGVLNAVRGAGTVTSSGVPDGFVMVERQASRVSFAVPEDWTEVSSDFREQMESMADSSGEPSLTVAGVWVNGDTAETSTQQVSVMHANFPGGPDDLALVAENTFAGFATNAPNVERVSDEDLTTAVGYPAHKSVATADFPNGAATITIYTIVQPSQYVGVMYTTLGGDDSAKIKVLVDTLQMK